MVGVERREKSRSSRFEKRNRFFFSKNIKNSFLFSSLSLTSGALKFSVSSLQCGLMTTFLR